MRQIPLAAIEEAAESVYQAAIRTPLVRLDLPFPQAGAPAPDVYLKLELLQPIGSFKIRGAWNAVRGLSSDTLNRGVWTVSAGNAAQGVAFAARRACAPCSVMVIVTAP
jgi:threonine dehydratase